MMFSRNELIHKILSSYLRRLIVTRAYYHFALFVKISLNISFTCFWRDNFTVYLIRQPVLGQRGPLDITGIRKLGNSGFSVFPQLGRQYYPFVF